MRMEQEMNQLQNKYRRLVSASKSESNGLERLKQDMGYLANELNDKRGILKKLVEQQQRIFIILVVGHPAITLPQT